MKRKLSKLVGFVVFVACILSLVLQFPAPARAAADFTINTERTFQVSEDKQFITITERRTITNNSSHYYIPAGNNEVFLIQNFKETLTEDEENLKSSTVSVVDQNGTALAYANSRNGEDLIIEVSYPTALNAHQSQIFELSYQTDELIETVGKITNISVPGLETDYQQITTDSGSGSTTEILYETSLHIPKSIDATAFTYPEPTSTSADADNIIYSFDTSAILGKSVWHQIGTDQIYSFKISQPTVKTDFSTSDQLSFLSQNKYTILLPRQYEETGQKVFFTKLSPNPAEVKQDEEGNLKASFYVDSNKDSVIEIEGYITVEKGRDLIPEDGTLTDISSGPDMSKYLAAAQYWEVNAPEIQQKAAELAADQITILDILRTDYQFIVSSIDYDDFKYGDRNQRQGALVTLNGGDSVCMEYSDLLIALTRAQGIPSRAAYGYGYDPKYSGNQLDHQWVQVWIPDYGWLTIDPTWGETGREFIGSDLDHALWYVTAKSPEDPTPLEIFSTTSGEDLDIEQSTIQIWAESEIPSGQEGKSVDELMDEIGSEESSISKLTHYLQTSSLGKSMIIVLPLCLVVVFAITLISAVTKLVARRKKSAAQQL